MGAARSALSLLVVAYPLMVFGGLWMLQPRVVASLLGVVLLARVVTRWRHVSRNAFRPLTPPVTAVLVVLALSALFNEGQVLLFVPVLMNLALLVTFARTLWRPPSVVEVLARLRHGSLSADAIVYCRRVTGVWCGFFLLNGGIILGLAVHGELARWTLYTGGVAYILMGLLFATEVMYRAWRFRRYDAGVVDCLLRRVFPPREAK